VGSGLPPLVRGLSPLNFPPNFTVLPRFDFFFKFPSLQARRWVDRSYASPEDFAKFFFSSSFLFYLSYFFFWVFPLPRQTNLSMSCVRRPLPAETAACLINYLQSYIHRAAPAISLFAPPFPPHLPLLSSSTASVVILLERVQRSLLGKNPSRTF